MKGKSMDSPVGLYSTKGNPMKKAKTVPCALNAKNPDAKKAAGLLQKAQKQIDSQRGMSGM